MSRTLPEPLLAQFSGFLADRIGLHFPRERWHDLVRALESASGEFDCPDAKSCVEWLLSSPLSRRQTEILASHLTVGETYFFREKRSFECLEEHVLTELIRSRRETDGRLRIWSAGCCTGEEPYSIAILLGKMIPDLKDWNVTILATDINPHFLRKGAQGVYKDWSFRETPPGFKEQHFKKTGDGQFEVPVHIKGMVTFSYLNLAEDVYPSLENNTNAMDIIFCRNVLMYFEPRRAKRVVRNLYRALMDGGWLFVSPTETSQSLFSRFATINFPGAILYRKGVDPVTVQPAMEVPSVLQIEEAAVPFQLPAESALDPRAILEVSKEFLRVDAEQPAPIMPADPYEEAVALYEQGRYADAADKIGALLSQHQNNAGAMALLARTYANQGSLSDALTWCKKAVAADKLNPGWCYLLATILHEQGKIEEAVTILKRALYLDQNFVLAHFALGNLARRQGKLKESEKHFNNALFLLEKYRQEEILPDSEGITAGRLVEIIQSTISSEALV